jgi:hypothetical protein
MNTYTSGYTALLTGHKQPATKDVTELKLRAYPRRKAGQPKVAFVYFEDAARLDNVLNYDLRQEAERCERAGLAWHLYHVNVSTRTPYPRCLDPHEPKYEDHPDQAESLYIPSRRAFGCAWGDTLQIPTWHGSSGSVASDLEGWLNAFYRSEIEAKGEQMTSDLLWGDWFPAFIPSETLERVNIVKTEPTAQPQPVKVKTNTPRKPRAPRFIIPGYGDWRTYQAALAAYREATQ